MSLTNIKNRPLQRQNILRDVTIRDFSGGWNVIDNDLNLSSKYAKILRNMVQSVDGANTIRPGTELFACVSDYINKIVNMEYFAEHLVVVGANGKIVRVDLDGNVALIWDDTWAGNLPGSPSGWRTTDFVSFATFNGSLVLCNGLDKPLSINNSMFVTFLQDLGTGSNVNTPIGRYVKTVGRYLVIAGDPNALSTVYISGTDNTTFVGDPSTDAVNYDLSSRVTHGSDVIKGLGTFRDRLVVAFEEMMLPVSLGTFTGSDHTPTFSDSIDNLGTVSHRTIQSLGEDMLFADPTGVHTIRRATFTGAIQSDSESSLIDPEIQSDMDRILDDSKGILAAENNVFSVYDSQARNYMLFVPNHPVTPTETRVFVYKKNKKLKQERWQEYSGWYVSAACRSQLRRIFLADATDTCLIWRMGEEHDVKNKNKHRITRDYVGYEEMFDDETPWSDGTGWTPISNLAESGVPIDWVWELPWADNDVRFNVKMSRYINFDTNGADKFTCSMFIDNIYEDPYYFGEPFTDGTLFDDGLGWDVEQLAPALSMDFAGGDGPGYGADEFGDYYGGNRPTRLETLYAWTEHYKINKLRFEGAGVEPLKFVSISMAYTQGSIRR